MKAPSTRTKQLRFMGQPEDKTYRQKDIPQGWLARWDTRQWCSPEEFRMVEQAMARKAERAAL